MSIVEIPSSKRRRERRLRSRQRDLYLSGAAASGNEIIIQGRTDESIAPPNPGNAQSILGDDEFKALIKKASTFLYGKAWFYNAVLEILLGIEWEKSKAIQIVHSAKELANPSQKTKSSGKPLLILPAVHDQVTLNILVSKALETKRPVWFVGYPSTLSKHLLVSFHSFFLCDASRNEIEILSDVTELSSQDTDFLKMPKRAVFISRGNANSIHLTF